MMTIDCCHQHPARCFLLLAAQSTRAKPFLHSLNVTYLFNERPEETHPRSLSRGTGLASIDGGIVYFSNWPSVRLIWCQGEKFELDYCRHVAITNERTNRRRGDWSIEANGNKSQMKNKQTSSIRARSQLARLTAPISFTHLPIIH